MAYSGTSGVRRRVLYITCNVVASGGTIHLGLFENTISSLRGMLSSSDLKAVLTNQGTYFSNDLADIRIRWNVVLGYMGRIKFVHKVICLFPNGGIN